MGSWLKRIDGRLQKGSRILELGCGMGVPTAKFLASRYDYLGIDISDEQITRARKLVPQGRFKRADMGRLKFPVRSFEAILSFYAIIHLPLREQRPLLRRIYRWLQPGGLFVATLGLGRWTGKEKDWHGAPMFWSHVDRKTYRRWLSEIGFKIERETLIREGKSGHPLFFCRKFS